MSWTTLRPQIATYIAAQISDLQEVATSPKLKFEAYPSAHIMPSDNSSDYETNQDNLRTYSFKLRLFYQTKKIGVAEALRRLEGSVDAAIDALDKEDLRGGSDRTIGIDLPAGYTFINILATPSVWLEIEDEKLFMAEINVAVRLSIDIT